MMEQRIWKISAGRYSRYWKSFIDDKVVAFGTWDEGNLNNYSYREELKEKMIAYSIQNYHKKSTSYFELWNFFKEMEISDIVVLYRKKAILAIGEITSKYKYNPENTYNGEAYHHVKSVKWKVFPQPFNKISELLYRKLSKPSDTFHEIKDKTCIAEIKRLLPIS